MYTVNCRRCNPDNSFTSLDPNCLKCSGRGLDWREDEALDGYHRWAGLSIDTLKSKGTSIVIRAGIKYVFTYRHTMLSTEQEQKEVMLRLASQPLTLSSCNHKWITQYERRVLMCSICGITEELPETRLSQVQSLVYDKKLYDHRYYYPNRCFGCFHYESTHSPQGNPMHADDEVTCGRGGIVKASDGCEHFEPDRSASCDDECWFFQQQWSETQNRDIYNCKLKGELHRIGLATGFCDLHVHKEATGEEPPLSNDSVDISRKFLIHRKKAFDLPLRKHVSDAMTLCQIKLISVYDTEFELNKGCETCQYCNYVEDDFAECNFHKIGLLSLSKNEQITTAICDKYVRRVDLPVVKYPKVTFVLVMKTKKQDQYGKYVFATESFYLSDELTLVADYKQWFIKRNSDKAIVARENINENGLPTWFQYIEETSSVAVRYQPKDEYEKGLIKMFPVK